MKILYLIDEMESISSGGTERQVLQMIRLAKEAGFDVDLCVLRGTGWLNEKDAGCRVHCADIAELATFQGIRRIGSLVRWIRKRRFDLVQTFFVEANLLGPILAKMAGVDIVVGSRRNTDYWMEPRMRVMQRISNFFVDRLVANSEMVKEVVAKVERFSPSRIDVIYNGIDVTSFKQDATQRSEIRTRYGIGEDQVLVGCVAALRPIKGTEHFVEVAAAILRSGANAVFMLVGDGPMEAELKCRVSQLAIERYFIFAGAQPDVLPYLNAFDIGALLSDAEGFSNSILEYMAISLPCVATDTGENRRMLLPDAGLIAERKNHDSMVQALSHLIKDRALRTSMGQSASTKVQQFNLVSTKTRLFEYYSNLIPSVRAVVQADFKADCIPSAPPALEVKRTRSSSPQLHS